jgi:hypothetical protein
LANLPGSAAGQIQSPETVYPAKFSGSGAVGKVPLTIPHLTSAIGAQALAAHRNSPCRNPRATIFTDQDDGSEGEGENQGRGGA